MHKIIKKIEKIFNGMNEKNQSVFLLSVIIICVILVCIGVAIEVYISNKNENSIEAKVGIGNTKSFKEYESIKNNFNELFTNELKCDQDISINKTNPDKDIVYSGYDLFSKNEDYYSVIAKIPIVNIDNPKIAEINQKIRVDFYDKADSIMKQKDKYIDYNVSYCAFLNQNILSIAIKASYKEVDKNEKIMLKTYNYDIDKLESVSLDTIMALKKITKSKVQNTIDSSIKVAYNYAKEYTENYYKRKLNSKIYKVKNTENYFYTNEGNLYIVYSYGNTDDSNEVDVILFD